MSADLPPDLAALPRNVDAQPSEMREIFHYAPAMLLVEDGGDHPRAANDRRTRMNLLFDDGVPTV